MTAKRKPTAAAPAERICKCGHDKILHSKAKPHACTYYVMTGKVGRFCACTRFTAPPKRRR